MTSGSAPTEFDFATGPALLARTPALLDAWLRGLPIGWLTGDEGPGTWDVLMVVGHLIEGERADWMPRVRHLLQHGDRVPFAPFDRFVQLAAPRRTIGALLDEFTLARTTSLAELRALDLGLPDLARLARHPEFGLVTLGQHLATWVAHDLTHVVQIARVMAKQLGAAVGPWQAYLRVLREA